jgi:hypothetical protein
MKQFTLIAVVAASLWLPTVHAEPFSEERFQTLRVTGMIVPYEVHLRGTFRTVSIFVNDKPWLFRISDVKELTDDPAVVPDIMEDESLLKDIRFTGPDALMRRLQKAHQLGRPLTIEGQLDAQERWFRVTTVEETPDTLLPNP